MNEINLSFYLLCNKVFVNGNSSYSMEDVGLGDLAKMAKNVE